MAYFKRQSYSRRTSKSSKKVTIPYAQFKNPARKKVDKRQDTEIRRLEKKVDKIAKNPECHYILQQNTLFGNITNSGAYLLLNPCQRGDTVQTRTGDYVSNKRIKIKGILTCGMEGPPFQASVRMILVCQKQNRNSATPFWHASSPAEGYLFADPLYMNTMYNFNNTDIKPQFKVLYDKVHKLIQPATSVPTTRIINLNFKINTHTSYKGGNVGDGTDIDRNAYYLLMWTDNTTQGVNFRFDSCFYFMDA